MHDSFFSDSCLHPENPTATKGEEKTTTPQALENETDPTLPTFNITEDSYEGPDAEPTEETETISKSTLPVQTTSSPAEIDNGSGGGSYELEPYTTVSTTKEMQTPLGDETKSHDEYSSTTQRKKNIQQCKLRTKIFVYEYSSVQD